MLKPEWTDDGDARLMCAYAQGDATAFETLYARYKGPLYRYFLHRCRRRESAEELYQETWMRVIRARGEYRVQAKFSTWLFRIAQNLLIDAGRKERGLVLEALPDDAPGADCDNPETQVADRERLRRYHALLRRLPEEQREVFLLKEESGLPLDEIATLLAIPFEAAKSRLRYAARKLRAGLQDETAGTTCSDE